MRIQKNVSLASYLSGKDELSTWQQESTFPDETILERCLSSRAFCTFGSSSWPLVFDPYNQFETYLRALERSEMKSRKGNNTHIFALKLYYTHHHHHHHIFFQHLVR